MESKKVLLNSAFFLLLFITVNLILVSVVFLFGGRIKSFYLLIEFLLTVGLYSFLLKKDSIGNKILGVGLGVLIFAVGIFACLNVYDFAHDSNWYHKAAIGAMKNGWNPIYQNFEGFADSANLGIKDLRYASTWTQHYPKASWIFGASVYSLTGNIETAKVMNLLMLYIVFSYLFFYLSDYRLKGYQAFVLSLLAVLNPLTLPQMFTLYTDNLLLSSLFLIIAVLFTIADNAFNIPKNFQYASLFCAVVICVNVKFTGLAYAGVFCLLFYGILLWNSYRQYKIKETFIKATMFLAITFGVGVLIVGSSCYVKNLVFHKSPFYPLAGENAVDIMTGNQPDRFAEMSAPQKVFVSLFSKTSNIYGAHFPELKIPFSIEEKEILMANKGFDIRIGGFGPLFSGIFCISLLVSGIGMYKLFGKSKKWFYIVTGVIGISILLLLCIKESWWARYSPYLYLLPMFALIMLFIGWNESRKKGMKVLLGLMSMALVALLVVNSSFFAQYIVTCAKETVSTKYMLSVLSETTEKQPAKVSLSYPSYFGAEFNLKDYGIQYHLVESGAHGENIYGMLVNWVDSINAVRTESE
ncbi:MAG: hypothetical protein J6M02_06330 [Clostridia bacterium]|nr:hypothetical protein [Clostridia bacterium]